eukprot:7561797-Alexandrium_andersonii.AAC.1
MRAQAADEGPRDLRLGGVHNGELGRARPPNPSSVDGLVERLPEWVPDDLRRVEARRLVDHA